GGFRGDLFHRLNVIRVRVPSLRERRDDIPLLLKHFLTSVANELKTAPKRARPDVVAHLASLDWPGNVRQLENACRWLTVMAPGRDIHLADLPPEFAVASGPAAAAPAPASPAGPAAPASAPRESERSNWPELLRPWAEL